MYRLNWNESIYVRLTEHGKDIYHRHYEKKIYPEEDKNGYTKMRLHEFMRIYGLHIDRGKEKVVDDISFHIGSKSLERTKDK